MEKTKGQPPTETTIVSRTLFEIMVQPSFVDTDANGNMTRVNSRPMVVSAKDLQAYVAGLLEYAERAKRGEIEQQISA